MADEGPSICPSLRYRDAAAAIDWLVEAFGFEQVAAHADDEGTVMHAELVYGNGMVMLGTERAGDEPSHVGQGWIYVVVEDPDSHHARAKAAGAEIVRELAYQDFGSRDYAARDLEGNLWSFGTYRPSLTPP